VIGIQNLVNYNGIFSQIANGKADFLRDRIVSGPFPAVEDLEWEFRESTKRYHILNGVPTWPGQSLDVCEAQMNEWGVNAFLEEAQHLITKKEGRVYHAFTDANIGPASYDLDYSKVEGYYHSHDFGAVNHVWGLWAKIGNQYFLIHEEKLPPGTTEARATRIKAVWRKTVQYLVADLMQQGIELEQAVKMALSKIIAGYGGAGSEEQYRRDFAHYGVTIRQPVTKAAAGDAIVEAQIRQSNQMFEAKTAMICRDMVNTLDQLENCIRDAKEEIADKAIWHYLDGCVRYFCAGVKRGVFVG
jgi:hypothetical protein